MSMFHFTETLLPERLEIHIVCPSCKNKIIFCPAKPNMANEEYITKLEKEIQLLRKRIFLLETHPYLKYDLR